MVIDITFVLFLMESSGNGASISSTFFAMLTAVSASAICWHPIV